MDDEHIMINICTVSYLALSCTGFYMSSNLLYNTQYFIIITNLNEIVLQKHNTYYKYECMYASVRTCTYINDFLKQSVDEHGV